MTSIDYASLMKKARASAKAKPLAMPSEDEPKMDLGMVEPKYAADVGQDYVVESYQYDMEQEIEAFHAIFEKWKVGTVDHAYYMPNFVTEEEESALLSNINGQSEDKWTQLKRRRLQNWGGNPSSEGMVEEGLPSWLDEISNRLAKESFLPKRPNHALINEYRGDEGISAHKDGPIYFPRVIILSLGGSTSMTFRDRLREPTHQSSLLLMPRSLLVFTKDAYDKYFHEIPVQIIDKVQPDCVNFGPNDLGMALTRTTRVSITLRVVPKTKKKA